MRQPILSPVAFFGGECVMHLLYIVGGLLASAQNISGVTRRVNGRPSPLLLFGLLLEQALLRLLQSTCTYAVHLSAPSGPGVWPWPRGAPHGGHIRASTLHSGRRNELSHTTAFSEHIKFPKLPAKFERHQSHAKPIEIRRTVQLPPG